MLDTYLPIGTLLRDSIRYGQKIVQISLNCWLYKQNHSSTATSIGSIEANESDTLELYKFSDDIEHNRLILLITSSQRFLRNRILQETTLFILYIFI